MKNSLIVLCFFLGGIGLGCLDLMPGPLAGGDLTVWVLYLLLFTAGMGVGFDLKVLAIVRELRGKILLIPLGVVAGSLGGSLAAWTVLEDLGMFDCLAVGAGFGYYSLATVIMTKLGSAGLGSLALLSNMIREIVTLTLAPLMVRLAGRLGPVMAGGAASMDTCLPAIAGASGEKYAIIGIFSGICLTLLVPVLVPALLALR